MEATRERLIAAAVADVRQVPIIREMPWASIPVQVYTPAAREAARRAAERLHPLFPEATTLGAIFVATWRGLERGVTIVDTLGAPLALRLGEERVAPAELLALLATDGAAARAAFEYWAGRVATT